jgi:hypothetical protein
MTSAAGAWAVSPELQLGVLGAFDEYQAPTERKQGSPWRSNTAFAPAGLVCSDPHNHGLKPVAKCLRAFGAGAQSPSTRVPAVDSA